MDAIKQALTRKVGIGKAKVPAWVLLLLLAAGVYWYYKRQAASSSVGPPAAVTPADTTGASVDTGAASGGGGGGAQPLSTDQTAPASFDPSGIIDELKSIEDLLATTPTPDTPTPVAVTPQPAAVAPVGTARPVTSQTKVAGTVLSPAGKVIQAPAGTTVVAEPPSRALPGPNLGIEIPAGATNVVRQANGTVTYTTRTGATIEQAPGQSRYRTSVGTSSIAPAPPPSAPAPSAAAKARTTASVAPARTSAPAATPAPAAAPAASKATVAKTNKAV